MDEKQVAWVHWNGTDEGVKLLSLIQDYAISERIFYAGFKAGLFVEASYHKYEIPADAETRWQHETCGYCLHGDDCLYFPKIKTWVCRTCAIKYKHVAAEGAREPNGLQIRTMPGAKPGSGLE